MNCILCGKDPKACRCRFAKPKRPHRSFSHEIYTTVPRTYQELLNTIHEAFKASVANGTKCIFKITVHAVKE